MRAFFSSRVVSLVLLAGMATACASTSQIRRGASVSEIHTGIKTAMEDEGYTCSYSPDKSILSCESSELLDINFAYLSGSNFVQAWATFTREDNTLVDEWKTGPCAPVQSHIDRVNGESISKIVCSDDAYRFEYFLWVTEEGLVDEDIHAFAGVVRNVVSEQINDGFLRPEDEAAPSTPTAPAPKGAEL